LTNTIAENIQLARRSRSHYRPIWWSGAPHQG